MLTIKDILAVMSKKNFMLSWVEHDFFNLGTWSDKVVLQTVGSTRMIIWINKYANTIEFYSTFPPLPVLTARAVGFFQHTRKSAVLRLITL